MLPAAHYGLMLQEASYWLQHLTTLVFSVGTLAHTHTHTEMHAHKHSCATHKQAQTGAQMQELTDFKLQQSYEPARCDTETTVAFALICLKRKTNRSMGLYADINLQISFSSLIFESVNEFHSYVILCDQLVIQHKENKNTTSVGIRDRDRANTYLNTHSIFYLCLSLLSPFIYKESFIEKGLHVWSFIHPAYMLA